MAGRTPKPTELLRISGNFRPGRHANRAREPKPDKITSTAPGWLLPEARAEWVRVCSGFAAAGILTRVDRGMLATYCQMFGRYVASEQAVPYDPLPASYVATMAGIANRLGLDPSGRTRLRTPDAEPNPDDAWAELRAINRKN